MDNTFEIFGDRYHESAGSCRKPIYPRELVHNKKFSYSIYTIPRFLMNTLRAKTEYMGSSERSRPVKA